MTTAWGFFELLLGLWCWGWLVRGGCSPLAKMQHCPPCWAGSPAVPFPQTTRQWDTRTWSVPARVYQQDGGELRVAVPTPMNKCLGISVEQTCRTKSVPCSGTHHSICKEVFVLYDTFRLLLSEETHLFFNNPCASTNNFSFTKRTL